MIFAVQSPEYGKYLGEQGQEVSTRGGFKVPYHSLFLIGCRTVVSLCKIHSAVQLSLYVIYSEI